MKTQIYRILENNVKIVEYDESYAKSLAHMWNESKDFWMGETTVYTEDSVKSDVENHGNINTYLAVAGQDEVVGYCGLSPSINDDQSVYINLLGVRPDYHGQGVGKALVELTIQQAIELGKARLDIHTWAGNTESMPLYKKTGFFWEENVNQIRLINFIPTVVTQPLFKDFFADEHWYKLSNRVIDTKPCGVKINTFEMFEYSFQKDDEMLKIGFERSGKRVRLIETNDYKIEFVANKHKLAFGLSYPATFQIENKSGKQLDIRIQGKSDQNIVCEGQFDAQVTDATKYETTFSVGEVKDFQSEYKVHPCVLADVTINGKTIEFGLGINTRFPLEIEFARKASVSRIGAKEKVYLSVKNLLLEDATVDFTLPENDRLSFSQRSITLDIPADGYGSIALDAQILNHGYVALPISYRIIPKNGEPFVYEKALHIELQGFSAKYYYEGEKEYVVANGPWAVHMDKNENWGVIKHLIHGNKAYLSNPEFGKPYRDEFMNIKPTSVTVVEIDGDLVLTYELHSKAFAGLVLKQIIRICASGYISQKCSVKNTATTAQNVVLKMPYYARFLRKQSVFAKGDHLTTNHGSMLFGTQAVEEKDFTENWLFEQHESAGVCWSKDFKADVGWSSIQLEKDFGGIGAGQTCETDEVEFVFGMFEHVTHFRDYVLEKYSAYHEPLKPFIALQTQDENPFVYDGNIALDVVNDRHTVLNGVFALSSQAGLFEDQLQTHTTEDVIEKYSFNVELEKRPDDGIGKFRLDLNLEEYDLTYKQAIFLPVGRVDCKEENGVWTVKNNQIAFKADPAYSEGVFSLLYLDQDEEREWLMHKYPEHVPHGYWNPFLGGIRPHPNALNERRILNEQKLAEFTWIKDNFDNEWTGIKMTVDVKEWEEDRGLLYENYFVTLPGLPILCHFSKIYNQTGAFKNVDFHLAVFPSGSENLAENDLTYVGSEKVTRSLHMGAEHYEDHKSPLVSLSSKRNEKLHFYQDVSDISSAESTNEYTELYKCFQVKLANGEAHTTRPVFIILTENEFIEEELVSLEKIRF